MKNYIKIILAIIALNSNVSYAQDFNLIGNAKPLYNPAFIGTQNMHEINIIGRKKTYKEKYVERNEDVRLMDYEAYIPTLKSGIGVYYSQFDELKRLKYEKDKKYNYNNLGFTYNFQSNIGEKWAFSIGSSVSYNTIKSYTDVNDCNLQFSPLYVCEEIEASHIPNFILNTNSDYFKQSFGGLIYSKKFNLSFATSKIYNSDVKRSFFGSMGYNIFFSKKTDHLLSFNLSVKDTSHNTQISLNTQYRYKFFSVGFAITENIPSTFSLKGGIHTKYFEIFYTYSHKSNGIITGGSGYWGPLPYRYSLSHEVALRFKIPQQNKRKSIPFNGQLF